MYSEEYDEGIAEMLHVKSPVANIQLGAIGEPYDIETSDVVEVGNSEVAVIIHFKTLGNFQIDIHEDDIRAIQDEPDIRFVRRNPANRMATIKIQLEIDISNDISFDPKKGGRVEHNISSLHVYARSEEMGLSFHPDGFRFKTTFGSKAGWVRFAPPGLYLRRGPDGSSPRVP